MMMEAWNICNRQSLALVTWEEGDFNGGEVEVV
jgi:hypothetical protein